MPAYKELSFPSSDGRLQLYARDYAADGPAIIMMHGLTRNGADFEGLAAHLAGKYRLVIPDQRGRGRSDNDPIPANYIPTTYCADMIAMITQFGLDRPILIGTSMGGLMAMIMGSMKPDQYRGIIINDIGPEVDQSGLDRIASFVGISASISNWGDAVAYCQRTNGPAFPDYGEEKWLAFAQRLFRENADGIPVLAYDPAISSGLARSNPTAVPPDLWPIWQGLAAIPVLVVRGELSDILSAQTLVRMGQTHPNMRAHNVAGTGHAPMLDEPDALFAVETFLSEIAG